MYGFYSNYKGVNGRTHYISSDNGNSIAVRGETVGQYTGLTDKYGRKIFEGDLVSYMIVTGGIEDLAIPANVRHIVKYDEKHGAFRIGYHYFCDGTMREVADANNLVVIGNIHDNPELLD